MDRSLHSKERAVGQGGERVDDATLEILDMHDRGAARFDPAHGENPGANPVDGDRHGLRVGIGAVGDVKADMVIRQRRQSSGELASWIATVPTPPAPPWIKTVS